MIYTVIASVILLYVENATSRLSDGQVLQLQKLVYDVIMYI